MSEKLSAAHFRLDLSGFVSNIWRVDLPESQSFEQCSDPRFWLHVSDKVAGENKENPRGIGDKINVFKRDTMEMRSYMISGIGAGFIKLIEAERYAGPATEEVAPDSPLTTRWNVGKRGHEVVRQEAGNLVTVLAGPFQAKGAAVDWINNHLKAMAA